ncbi:MAG: type IV toxin-antitoxin system AbiEi family antitoxin [bacterium]
MGSNEKSVEGNIYSDKSSLILDWILREGVKSQEFSLRKVANEVGVSLGLVQRVFEILVLKGILQTEGVRTAKKFFPKNLKLLLESWLKQYSVVKKCKMRTYHSGFQDKTELLEALKKSNLNKKVALALHSAADVHRCKNTNLNTLELYLLDPLVRQQLEKKLLLEPQEKGYEVLLIEPYYKSLLKSVYDASQDINSSPPILTFLDLYHFPLRGQEQAEFMAGRLPELKRIYKHGGS